jgi:hypothetical protein
MFERPSMLTNEKKGGAEDSRWLQPASKEKGRHMVKKRYNVRGRCPQCACGDVSFLGPEKLRDKYIGDENEIEILCPACGTKHSGILEEGDRKGD